MLLSPINKASSTIALLLFCPSLVGRMVVASPLQLPTALNTPTSSGPALYDPTTGPTCDDITQTTAPDCWLASVMCALAKSNQGFIKDLFVDQTTAGNTQTSLSVVAVTAKVWDPDTLVEEDQDVTLSDTGNGTGNDDASGYVWWPSALQAAVKKHGGPGITDGKFDDNGSLANKALSYLSGKEAVLNKDNSTWWDSLVSYVDRSPMTVCTNTKTSKLVDSHCYTAMTVTENDDTDDRRKVRLHNPWGSAKDYKMSKIIDDIQHYMTGSSSSLNNQEATYKRGGEAADTSLSGGRQT